MVYSYKKFIFRKLDQAAKSPTVSSEQAAKRPSTTAVCVHHFGCLYFMCKFGLISHCSLEYFVTISIQQGDETSWAPGEQVWT